MVPDYLFKVAKKKQNFGKVARSCSSAKKLLRGQKVAKKSPSTIWLCLQWNAHFLAQRLENDLVVVKEAIRLSSCSFAFTTTPDANSRLKTWSKLSLLFYIYIYIYIFFFLTALLGTKYITLITYKYKQTCSS